MARGQWTQGSGGGLDTSEVTATTDKVLKGYTAGVKDSDEPVEGTLEVQSIVNFKVSLYGHLSLTGTWQNPAKGPYSGVMIRYKAGSYPAGVYDGSLAYEGAGNSCTISGLTAGTTYYFCAWAYMTTNIGRIYAHGYQQTAVVAQAVKGNKTFTSSGSWTVPAGVKSIDLFCVGGGAAGDTGAGWGYWGGDGGGGGYTKTVRRIAVSPGQMLTVNVAGQSGTSSVVRSGAILCSAAGAKGDDGGSGGGAGDVLDRNRKHRGGSGGEDGSDGGNSDRDNGVPGTGQHTTTRAFGESSGTLYAGGGAGASYYGGTAGAGGGGHPEGGAGANGTGGGGGAGALVAGGRGGSGVVLIRWGY